MFTNSQITINKKKRGCSTQYSESTIAAIATGYGGGIGIIRLSGNEAISIVKKIFKPYKNVDLIKVPTHSIHYGEIKNHRKLYDQALVSIMRNPKSYTGEDVVEISTHGSCIIMNDILQLCIHHGAKLADKGEFTKRAYLNRKIDLIQAEAVADLINANTRTAGEIALGHIKGSLSKKIGEYKDKIKELIVQLEVRIEYPDEDVEPLKKEQLNKILTLMIYEIERVVSTLGNVELIKNGVSVGIIGRTNVGKSSIFNRCINQEKALISNIPGTTRDLIEKELVYNDISVKLVDTAGIRVITQCPLEKMSMEKTKQALETVKLLIFVLDASKELNRDDLDIAKSIKENWNPEKVIIVLNKIDLKKVLIDKDIKRIFQNYSKSNVIEVSAKTGEGISRLMGKIAQKSKNLIKNLPEDNIISNIRQKHYLEEVASSLRSAKSSLMSDEQEVLVTSDLKSALASLGELVGSVTSEEILDTIFDNFCVGK
ncbi:MAG: tRNA uridine-5-carboxymethylaminomethyl(34) synthesis GTPase MnmE [bacterium]